MILPVLMLNGHHDVVFPLEISQEPFFRLLGTPPEHKQHYIYPLGHLVPRDQVIEKAIGWFDRYLGAP